MVAPVITIGGRRIADRPVRGTAHAAVSQVRIEWGRETLFDAPAPGVATIQIINRGLTPVVHAKGAAVLIERPEVGVLFRGKIADTDTSAPTYVRLANGLREKITVTTITAHDALAAFAKFIPTGPSAGLPSGFVPGQYSEGIGGWHEVPSSTRIEQIRDAGADRFVTGQWGIPGFVVDTDPAVQSYSAPRKPSETSALELLYHAYAARRPLSAFAYVPGADIIAAAHHADPTDSIITLTPGTGGTLRIALDADVAALPAGRIQLDKNAKLHAPADDVSEVRIEWHQYRLATQNNAEFLAEVVEGASAARVPGATSGSTYTSPFRSFVPLTQTTSPEQWRYRAWWLALAAERFAALNGLPTLPPLTIDPEDAAFTGLAWRTYQTVSAFYLAGSMFSSEGAPAVVQFIGGALTYDERGRWRHRLTPVPTAGGAPDGLTLAEMFPTASTDRLDAWADDLTINDLAAANRRA